MPLSERKKKILQALLDDYISTAAPISSKEIQLKHLPELSSATIRNELSTLESMGYLVQPHVSAGRIPSEKAFRLYVDELMPARKLSEGELELIEKFLREKITDIEDIVINVAKVISNITNYTSVAMKSSDIEQEVTNIKLVQLTDTSILAVIVTNSQVFKDSIVSLTYELDTKSVESASNYLNKLLRGKKLRELQDYEYLETALSEEFRYYEQLYYKVLAIIKKMTSRQQLITEGSSKIFQYPEYSTDIGKAKSFLATLESEERMLALVEGGDVEFSIKIGAEDDASIPSGCSLITAKLKLNDRDIGTAGVIGPVRMDYQKVISVLSEINNLVGKILSDEEEK